MKILMFSPLFYPHIGGVEKHVMRLSEELIQFGHEVSIITIRHNQTLSEFEILNKISIYRSSNSLPKIWFWIFKHRELIKKADIVHCHDFSSFIFWYFPFKVFYPLKSVFVTFHGYEGIIPIPKKILFLRKATEILTNGNICIGDFIPRWYGTTADIISYGGVDETVNTDITSHDNSAVFIGRLEKDTGILTYVDAIGILKNKYSTNVELNICGDGRLREEIEKIIKENDLNIKLHGFVENPVDYLIKSRFAFVSGYLAILEAMINKKIVFSLYENELKKDYLALLPNAEEIMVISSSSEELAKKISYYYKNSEKIEKVINNAYNFAKNNTWEMVANSYLKLWNAKKGRIL